MSKDITVIIPNYNCLEFLPKAINSVLNQQGVRIELLIVDDGSTDGSLEWLQQAEKKHHQIRLIAQANKGVIAARNIAIQKANSDYIAFLDADDYWHPNKLSQQLEFMHQNPQCGLTFTNYQHVDMAYKDIIDCFAYWPEFYQQIKKDNLSGYRMLPDAISTLLEVNVVGTSCVMVKKSVIEAAGGFDPSLKSAEDWDCWLRMALISEVGFTDDITMGYLMRPNSATADRQGRIDAMVDIIERMRMQPKVKEKSVQKAFTRLNDSYREMYHEQQNYKKALSYAFKSFCQAPSKRHLKYLLSDLKHLMNLTNFQHAK